eukprot:308029_1
MENILKHLKNKTFPKLSMIGLLVQKNSDLNISDAISAYRHKYNKEVEFDLEDGTRNNLFITGTGYFKVRGGFNDDLMNEDEEKEIMHLFEQEMMNQENTSSAQAFMNTIQSFTKYFDKSMEPETGLNF